MSITLKLLNEGFEKKYLQEADKRPKSWILFFDEDGINRVGSDGSRPSDLSPANAERLLHSSDYSIPKWAKSYVILTDNQFMTIDYDSLEKFHDKYGKEIPTNESLKESDEELLKEYRTKGTKNKMRLEIAGKPSNAAFAIQDTGLKHTMYQKKIKNIISNLDNDYYGGEDDDKLQDEFFLCVDGRKPGILEEVGARYIEDVNELMDYISRAFSLVKNGECRRAAILTPDENILVDYGYADEFAPVNESLKEEWIHFQYKSGANPYIAKNQKEAERIIKKYGKDKIKELRKGFYEIDDSEESLEEDTTYKAGPFEFSSNLGSKALDTASNIFGKTVDNIEPIVKNIGPIAGAISKVAPLLADDASEKKEVFRNDNGEDYDVIERSKTGKNALLNKGKQWIVASNCPEENEGSWGQGHYFFNEKSARKVWEDGYLDESLKEDKLSKFPRKKIEAGDKQVTKQVLADDFNEKNLDKISTAEYEANKNRHRRIDLYRKYAHLDEDAEITEDNIDNWALGKVACRVNREPAKVKAEILGQRYSDYEKY